MIELEHSPLGGSGAKRFMSCTGSFLLHREEILDGTFEDVPSEFAALGTAAHALAAVCLEECTEPYEYLGEDFDGYLAGWPDGIDLNAVQFYVNECRSIMDHCGDGLAIVEKTYRAPKLHKLLKGTVDFGYLSPSRGVFLRDYKNGEGIGVSSPNNPQLLYYAFLLLLNAPQEMSDAWTLVTPVNLGIVQPNFYGLFEPVEAWITTVGEVMDWGRNKLLPTMTALYEHSPDYRDEDFVTGEHCQFCPVLLSCPKMQAAFRLYADASEDFITMLSNAELDALYAERENVRRFMKVLETTVHHRMVTGGTIHSAKLVEKQTARVWKPGGEAAVAAAFGEKAYAPKKVISPAGAEKLSSRGKEIALEWGYKPDSAGLVVAPLSDRRPEAKRPGNAGVFAAHAIAQYEDF